MTFGGEEGQTLSEYAVIAVILTAVFVACAALLEGAVAVFHDQVVSVICLPLP